MHLVSELLVQEPDLQIIISLPLASSLTGIDRPLDKNDGVFVLVMESEIYFVGFSAGILLKGDPQFEQLAGNILLDVRVVALALTQVVFSLTGFKDCVRDSLDKVDGDKTLLNEPVNVNLDLVEHH